MGRGDSRQVPSKNAAPPKTKLSIGEQKKLRQEEARQERRQEIADQVADGSLIIRQATPAERAEW